MITDDAALKAACDAASSVPAIALDTEFVRTRTYYPQLGLIQMFDGETVVLIDPLTIGDWTPMRDLLVNKNVTKYLHAGSEDLEVFLNAFGVLPDPLIDTQILAAFCGRPMSGALRRWLKSTPALRWTRASPAPTGWRAR